MEGKATSKLVEIDTRTSCLELALDQFPVDVTNCIPQWMTFKDEHMILCSSGNYCLLGTRSLTQQQLMEILSREFSVMKMK